MLFKNVSKIMSAREGLKQFVACNSNGSFDTIKLIIYCLVYTIAGRSYSELCHLAPQQDSKSNLLLMRCHKIIKCWNSYSEQAYLVINAFVTQPILLIAALAKENEHIHFATLP